MPVNVPLSFSLLCFQIVHGEAKTMEETATFEHFHLHFYLIVNDISSVSINHGGKYCELLGKTVTCHFIYF